MKIRRIYIDNFGKLNNFTKEFTDGLNCIEEDNGWGKSTIASFIRVMFFGFENESKSKANREREILRPWNGGRYGGYIEFEHGGKRYRVTRTFKEKADDEFQLLDLDTGSVSSDFSNELGKDIFEIDSAGFMRTLFIRQEDIDSSLTDKIKAKLGNIAGLDDDLSKYEAADEKLKKMTGSGAGVGIAGKIRNCQKDLNEYDAQIRALPSVSKAADDINVLIRTGREQLSAEKQTLDALREEHKTVSDKRLYREKKDTYDRLTEGRATREKTLDACRAVFSGNIPDEGELDEKAADAAELRRREIKLEGMRPSPEQEAFLAKYASVYAAGVPSPDSMDRAKEQLKLQREKEREYSALQFSQEEKADFEDYCRRFADKDDVDSETDDCIAIWSGLGARRAELESKKRQLAGLRESAETQGGSEKGVPAFALLIAGALLIVAGVLVIAMRSVLPGLVPAAIGIVLCILGISQRKRTVESADDAGSAALKIAEFEAQIEKDSVGIVGDSAYVTDFAASMGMPFEEGVMLNSLYKIKADHARYRQLVQKRDDKRDDILAEEIASISAGIRSFLFPYSGVFTGLTDDGDKLDKLRENVRCYVDFRERKANCDRGHALLAREKEALLGYARDHGFYDRGSDIGSLFTEMTTAFGKYKDALTEYKKADAAVSEFESSNNMAKVLAADPGTDLRSIEQIDYEIGVQEDRIEQIRGSLREYGEQLDGKLQRLDELAELKVICGEKSDELNELKKKLRLVEKTRELLALSYSSFTGRYKQPVEDAFRKYCRLLGGENGENCVLNARMELSVDEAGILRKPSLYSSGVQDKINLCMRMGVIDAMYKGEKPFIVMDDPFTNLDNERLKGGLEMIRTLSEDRQVIYFTCHDSRAV